MAFKNGVINLQAAGYYGARTVLLNEDLKSTETQDTALLRLNCI